MFYESIKDAVILISIFIIQSDDTEDADRMYELWAIVVHIGSGPHHGHYVAIIKSNGQWMLFDDDVVTVSVVCGSM